MILREIDCFQQFAGRLFVNNSQYIPLKNYYQKCQNAKSYRVYKY